MNEFIEFMSKYWFQIAAGLFAIIQIILIIIKRKPKSIDDFKAILNEVLATVPELVISRERPGEGTNKKKEVEICCKKLIERRLGRCLSDKEFLLTKELIDEKIETVLSTPTKKEILNEK